MIIVFVLFFKIINLTGGKFIYTLDDAYIHLACAKNLVISNVWGVTQYELSPATSSPVWTMLLSILFSAFGVNDLIPLIVNFLLASILLYVIFSLLKQYHVSDFFNVIVLITVIVLTPLPFFIFSGMEHILHAILTILFLKYSAQSLCQSDIKNKFGKSDKYLLLTSGFLILVRYESIILLFIIVALFLIKKKYSTGIIQLVTGLALPCLFGIYLILKDGYFLPNPVMLKGNFFNSINDLSSAPVIENTFWYLELSKKILIFFLITLVLFYIQIKSANNFWSKIPLMLFVLMIMIFIQKIGFLPAVFRYDAYLVITSIAVNSLAVYDYCKKKYNLDLNSKLLRNKIALIIFIIYSVCLIYKSYDFEYTFIASKNIYEQQYQMSRFTDKYYSGQHIALNDIGAVNYYSDIHCLDLIGLASNDVAKEKLNGSFNTDAMNEIAKKNKLKIAIVYDEWFRDESGIPDEWIKAGEWKITDNYICGSDYISFYAVDKNEITNLKENLKSFAGELPSTVLQTGDYLKND